MAGTATVPEEAGVSRARRARSVRRLFIAGLTVFLVLGALNVYGVRSRTVTASAEGYELSVTYAAVTRPGLASVWSVELRREGGFDGPIELASLASYFDVFDENGLDPDPASATTDGQRIIWEFDPPEDSDTLTVSFDARIEPAVQLDRVTGRTSVLEDGQPVATVVYRTWVFP